MYEEENEIVDYEFQKCVRYINNLNSDIKFDFYKLYGLYKQSLFGNNEIEKPLFLYFRSNNKWVSWKNNYGKSKIEAKKEYILKVEEIKFFS
jgi:acyl-CoA-binding protein